MRVLIVEDHELFARALETVIAKLAPGAAVTLVASAELAAEALKEPFELVLLDLGLPGRRGVAAFDLLQATATRAAIVLVSGAEPGPEIVTMIQRGARGFIHKRASVSELTTTLRFIVDGGTHVPPELLAIEAPSQIAFTPRQTEVLRLLAKGSSNKEIADELGCAEATVRVHVSTIMRLLDVENRTQVATSAAARRMLDDGFQSG